jgi:D-amino-acid oxidase
MVATDIGIKSRSIVATAIWHVYLVDNNDIRTLSWAKMTLERLLSIEKLNQKAGICRVQGVELFRKSDAHLPTWCDIPPMFEPLTAGEIAEFQNLDAPENAIRPIKWGYRIEAPSADMSIYLPWLLNEVEKKGVKVSQEAVIDLQDCFQYADIIVNCTGYGSHILHPEANIIPVRGQYIVFDCDSDGPTCYFGDDDHPTETSYFIPRLGEAILGGTEEFGIEAIEFDRSVSDFIERVSPFEPWVQGLAGLEPKRLVVGIRPYRVDGVLLTATEQGDNRLLVHNVGHGGSGFSLSWGCAAEVKGMIDSFVSHRAAGR